MAKASVEQLDFSNVKDGGAFKKIHQPAGDYRAKIMSVADATKKDDKKVKMWLFTIKVGPGVYPYYCTRTAENQLWKIRNLFVAAGIAVPKKRVAVDPNKLVNRDIAVTLEDDDYEGKPQSSISSTFPLSELEEDDEPKPKEKKSKDKGEDPVEAPQGKKGKKDKAGKKAKKADDVSDEELEELDVESV